MEYFGGPGGPVLMVKDIRQDFFWKIFETMGIHAQQRTMHLFHNGYYSVADYRVMNTLKIILSFEKRKMLKIWTEPNQTELLYVDVGYFDEDRLIKNSKAWIQKILHVKQLEQVWNPVPGKIRTFSSG